METKRNLKYFLEKGIPVLTIVFLALTAVGVILAVFAGRATSLLMIGVLLAVVGLCGLMFASGGKANELDIDAGCMALTKDLEECATKRFEV